MASDIHLEARDNQKVLNLEISHQTEKRCRGDSG